MFGCHFLPSCLGFGSATPPACSVPASSIPGLSWAYPGPRVCTLGPRVCALGPRVCTLGPRVCTRHATASEDGGGGLLSAAPQMVRPERSVDNEPRTTERRLAVLWACRCLCPGPPKRPYDRPKSPRLRVFAPFGAALDPPPPTMHIYMAVNTGWGWGGFRELTTKFPVIGL